VIPFQVFSVKSFLLEAMIQGLTLRDDSGFSLWTFWNNRFNCISSALSLVEFADKMTTSLENVETELECSLTKILSRVGRQIN
jgi:hypothetical protein